MLRFVSAFVAIAACNAAGSDTKMSLDAAKNTVVSRVVRETVSIFDLKSDSDAAAKKAAQLASTLDLHGVKVTNLEDNVKQIRTDVSDMRQDVRKLSDSVSKVAVLDKTVGALDESVKGKLSSFETANKKSISDLEAANDKKIKALQALVAAEIKKAKEDGGKIKMENMPAETVLQTVVKNSEITHNIGCPSYGNNMNNYRKSNFWIEIVTKRDNSRFLVNGNVFMRGSNAHSHYYMDMRREINGGSVKSMVEYLRNNRNTDQITGAHPNSNMGGYERGQEYNTMFMDTVKVKKGTKLRWTIWVAAWSGGTVYLGGWNSNQQGLNPLTVQEIARE